jgi:hypothetical protein
VFSFVINHNFFCLSGGCGRWRAIDLKSNLNLNTLSESLVRYNLLINNIYATTPPCRQARKHWEAPVGVETLFCVRIIIKTCYLSFFIYKILFR